MNDPGVFSQSAVNGQTSRLHSLSSKKILRIITTPKLGNVPNNLWLTFGQTAVETFADLVRTKKCIKVTAVTWTFSTIGYHIICASQGLETRPTLAGKHPVFVDTDSIGVTVMEAKCTFIDICK